MILILLFIVLIYFNSCAGLNPDTKAENQIQLTEKNIHLLNGTYSDINFNEKPKQSSSLYNHFYFRVFNVGKDSLRFVNLKLINSRKLKVTLLKNDSIVSSKYLKRKLKDGYFVINRKIRPLPTIYLNVFSSRKCRLGLFNNGNLTTDLNEISWGTGFFFVPFYSTLKVFDTEFKKINQ